LRHERPRGLELRCGRGYYDDYGDRRY